MNVSSFHAHGSFCWLSEDAAMVEHTLELQFRLDDVEDNNRYEGKHKLLGTAAPSLWAWP